jgi:hypothetical protein
MKTVWVFASVLAAAGGCKKSVKNDEVEAFVQRRATELGIPNAKASCPSGVEAKVGASFDCKIDIDGTTYVLVATITSLEGTKLSIDTAWKDGEAVISSKLSAALSGELSTQMETPVKVECGEPLRFLDKDRNVACDLVAGSTKAKLLVTFDDNLAPTNWKVQPPLLAKAALERLLTDPVRSKTSAAVTVACGDEPLLARPADGIVWCQASDGDRAAKIQVEVGPDLVVTRWQLVD